jgi:hypothetical protein
MTSLSGNQTADSGEGTRGAVFLLGARHDTEMGKADETTNAAAGNGGHRHFSVKALPA